MTVADSRRHPSRRRGAPRGAPPEPRPEDEPAAEEALLPPGRRDANGFWIPAGYDSPAALFTPQQRRLQEKQRQAHRARRRVDSPKGSE